MSELELFNGIKISPEELKFKGIAYHKIDRGGSLTVLEPGQIVLYPIININYYQHTFRSFVAILEQVNIVIAFRSEINAGACVEKKQNRCSWYSNFKQSHKTWTCF